MTTLTEGAFAKINLTLDVLDRREDGYHDIRSILQTVALRDDIELLLDTGSRLFFHNSLPPVPSVRAGGPWVYR